MWQRLQPLCQASALQPSRLLLGLWRMYGPMALMHGSQSAKGNASWFKDKSCERDKSCEGLALFQSCKQIVALTLFITAHFSQKVDLPCKRDIKMHGKM